MEIRSIVRINKIYLYLFFLLLVFASFISWRLLDREDPLPSWEEGKTKESIIEFVNHVTQEGSDQFLPVEDRIAVFNLDGTLWPELPPAEGVFILKQVKLLVDKNPKLKNKQPYKEILDKDLEYFEKGGIKSVMEAMAISYANKSVNEFRSEASSFLETEMHPRYKVPFRKLAYKPMLELLTFLRSNGFSTWICSGGSVDFIRLISMEMYGIPPEQIIGSRFESEFVEDGNEWTIKRKVKLASFNEKKEKPVNISNYIGKQPVFTCGNVKAGGDLAMFTYTQQQKRRTYIMMINHDDGINEFTYEDKAKESLKTAMENNWTVVSIKNDWLEIFNSPVVEQTNKIKIKKL
jgi:phosphoserine phosphatase